MTGESALQWFVRLKQPSVCLVSGHEEFDEILGNSLPLKSVTEIVGEAGIGKIELAITIVAKMLTSPDKCAWVAIILDYNGTFRTDRLLHVIRQITGHKDDRVGMHLLKRVFFERVYTCEELKSSFVRLTNQFNSNEIIPLVVVNEVGAILSDTSFTEQQGSYEQDQVLRLMRAFCGTNGGTVIATNHIVHWRGYASPALGNTWIQGISSRILLSRDELSGELFATFQDRSPHRINSTSRYEICNGRFSACVKPKDEPVQKMEISAKQEVDIELLKGEINIS